MKPKKIITKESLRIETERLIIRPFELRDVEPSYQMNLDPEINRYTGEGGVASKKEIERRIVENVFGDYEKYGFGRLAVEWKATGEFIGFTGLKYLEDMDEIDLGYRLLKEYWGKGIATEGGKISLELGFSKLGLDQIIALIMPANIASIRVAEKLGLTYQKDIIEDGEDVKFYSISNPQK